MPTSTRKSMGQARNRPHIPYRHDDFQHGKRTGMAVDVVDRNSDDFEPFDKVISQADARTPPKVQGRKKKQPALSPVGDDTNGEMSMDLDLDNSYDSPMAYYSNQRVPVAPNSVRRIGSSSRPVHHSPDVDFDQLPSPRPAAKSALSRRQSKANGKSPGPSRLSHSFVPPLPDPDSSDDDNGGGFEPMSGQFPPPSPEHTSFTQIDQDEDDEEEEEQIMDAIFSPQETVNRGKRKSTDGDGRSKLTSHHARNGRKSMPNEHANEGEDSEAEEEKESSKKVNPKNHRKGRLAEEDGGDAEEEIVQAMNDVEMDVPEEDQEEERTSREDFNRRQRNLSDIAEEPEEPGEDKKPAKKTKKSRRRDENTNEQQPPNKKLRTVVKGRGRTPFADKTSESHVVRLRSVSPENPDGLRRGRRYRYKPLEFWRLEKVVYGRPDDTDKPNLLAPIREIIRLPKEDVQPLGGKKSRRWARPNSKSKTVEPEQLIYNPEEGWDDGTEPQGHVVDYTTKTEVERRVAYTAKMVSPVGDDRFKYQKIFGDGDFIAAGQLIIPPGGEKPSKGTKDNTYVFYVIEGAVNLKIHTTSFVICTGGCFLVPRGNVYYIKNICSRSARLFFAQARKVPAGAAEFHLLPQPPTRNSTEGADRSSNTRDISERPAAKKSAAKRPQSMNLK